MEKTYNVPYITITNIDIENQLCVNSVPSAGHESFTQGDTSTSNIHIVDGTDDDSPF
jgi:hypothetical protein